MQTKKLDSVCTNLYVITEHVDTVFRCLRMHVTVRTQLLDGTHHAAGFHTAKFTFLNLDTTGCHFSVVISCYTATVKNYRNLLSHFYVGSSGNNLYSLTTHIYLAYHQLICVRMGLDLFDLSNHDLVQIRIQSHITLGLCSGQGHGIYIFLICRCQIRHIFFNP